MLKVKNACNISHTFKTQFVFATAFTIFPVNKFLMNKFHINLCECHNTNKFGIVFNSCIYLAAGNESTAKCLPSARVQLQQP